MADDTVKKTLVYGVEADFKSLGQGVKELIGVLKTVDQSFKSMGKELADSLKLARKGINELEKPMQEMGKGFQAGFKAISQELKLVSKDMQAMRAEFKNALGYVQGESQKTGRAINQLAQQTVQMGKSVQQANKVSSESMKSFAAENKKTQESLRGLAKEAKNFKDHAHSAGQALQTLGLMAGALGAGLSAGIGGAAMEFGNFEAQIIKFSAVSGATAEEMKAIEEQAMKLGASTKFTAQEIGAAQVELAKMGFSAKETTDAMGAMVEASIASGESLAETSTIVATTLRMFNMQASEAGTVSDIITRGANISAQSFDSFANSIRYVGSAAAASNQDLVDISGLLAILADRGIKGTVAGNGLQNALLRLQAPTKAAREAMQELNLAIADTKGTADTADDTLRPMLDIIKDIKTTFAERGTNSIAQADYLKDLFGEVALNTMQVFMNTSNEVMDATMAKQADYLGSTKETADKMRQGQNQAIEEMKSAINGLQIAIGKELAPTIIALAKGVEALVNSFSSLPKPILSAISHIGLLAAAVTTAFAGAAGISFVVGTGTKAFKDFGAAVAASPAGPGIKKVGADTAASFATINGAVKGSKLYAYLGMAGNTFKGFLAAFKPFVGKILFGMGEIALVAVAVHKAWKTNFGGLKDITRNFTDWLVGENNEALTQWKSEWDSMWSSAGQTFNGVWTGMVDTLISFLGFMDETTGAFFSMIDHISKAARAAADRDWDWFKAEALNAKTEAQTILSNIFDPNSLAQNDAKLNAMRERARKKFFGAAKQEQAAVKDVAKTQAVATAAAIEGQNTKLDLLDDELAKQKKLLDIELRRAKNGITDAPSGPTQQRYDPAIAGAPTNSGYGPRGGRLHAGNDAAQDAGRPILAQSDGVVAHVGNHGKKGWGKFVVVDNGDGTYWLYGHSSDVYAKVGQSVKRGVTNLGAVGSTGSSSGPHIHTELRRGIRGLTGAATYQQTVAVNPNIGVETTGANTAEAQIRAAEIKYHTEMVTLLSRFKNAYQQVLKTASGDEAKAAEKAVLDLAGEIEDQQGHLKELGAEAAKESAEAGKEALEALRKAISGQIKAYSDYYKNVVDAAQNAADAGKEAFYKSLKGDVGTEEEALFGLDKMSEQILSGRSELAGLADAIAEIKKDTGLMGPDQRQELQDLEAQYKALYEQLGRLNWQYEKMSGSRIGGEGDSASPMANGALSGVKIGGGRGPQKFGSLSTVAVALAQADFDAWSKEAGEATTKALEFMDAIIANDEALDHLNSSTKDGKINMRFLAEQMGMTEEQFKALGLSLDYIDLEKLLKQLKITELQADKLISALGRREGVVEFKKNIEAAVDVAEKAKTEFSNFMGQIQNVSSGVSGAIRDISGFFQSFSKEAESNFSIVAQGLAEVGGGVVSIASGIKDSNPFAIISGSLQSMNGFLEAGVKLMARLKNEVIGLYHAQNQGGVAEAENAARAAQANLAALRTSGGSAVDIFNAANQATRTDLEARQSGVMAQFRKQYGRDFALDKDAQGNDDIAATISRYKNSILDPKTSAAEKTRKQEIVNNLESMLGVLGQIASQAQQDFTSNLQEFVDKSMEGGEKLKSYWENLDKESEAKRVTDQLIGDTLGLNPGDVLDENGGAGVLGEALRQTAEKFAGDRAAIFAEVEQHFKTGTSEYYDELGRRLGEWDKTAKKAMADALIEAQTKAIETATAARDKAFSEAQEQIKKDVEEAKRAQKAAYDNETKVLRESLKLDQERLERMERQTQEVQRQIQLKNEDRQKDLDAFNAADKKAFTKMKGAVNYDVEIRKALDEIHNPDGVETGTYSTESLREAAKEQIELLKLRNQNAFDEEDKSEKDYLKRIEEIAALEARFAQEALTGANLTAREQVELERIKAQAYKDFQQARIDSINAGYDAEVAVLEKRISDNNRQAQSYRDSIDANNLKLEEFNTKYEANIQALDDGLNALIATQDGIGLGLVALADGIDGPMAKITEKYQGLERKINNAYQAALKLNAATGTTYSVPSTNYTPYSSAPLQSGSGTADMSAFWAPKAKKMKTGGQVPDGFPNDTYPAFLSSRETVIPEPLTSDLLAHLNRIASLPPVNIAQGGSQYNTPVNVHIYDANDTEAVKRTVIGALKEAGVNPNTAAMNGGYYGSLGLN